MKFKLATTRGSYNFLPDDDGQEWIDKLTELGFVFTRLVNLSDNTLTDYSEFEPEIEIELHSLEELVELTEKYGEIIIKGNVLEIYNGYRE